MCCQMPSLQQVLKSQSRVCLERVSTEALAGNSTFPALKSPPKKPSTWFQSCTSCPDKPRGGTGGWFCCAACLPHGKNPPKTHKKELNLAQQPPNNKKRPSCTQVCENWQKSSMRGQKPTTFWHNPQIKAKWSETQLKTLLNDKLRQRKGLKGHFWRKMGKNCVNSNSKAPKKQKNPKITKNHQKTPAKHPQNSRRTVAEHSQNTRRTLAEHSQINFFVFPNFPLRQLCFCVLWMRFFRFS